ncbi:TPA: hypothetical protein U1199_000477 [Streptococcus suis]|nr:hypothetical protein [Streptococcus suis]HEM5046286.1 hypothetical protein [Streptococcus suis]
MKSRTQNWRSKVLHTKEDIFKLLKEYRWFIDILGSGVVIAITSSFLKFLQIPPEMINAVIFGIAISISCGVIAYSNFQRKIIIDKQEMSDDSLISLSENSKNSFYQLQIALKYLDKHAGKFRFSLNNVADSRNGIIKAKKSFISDNKDCFRMICSDFSNFLDMFKLKRVGVRFHIHFLTKDINIIKGLYMEELDKVSAKYYSFFDDEITFQEKIRSNTDSEYISRKITREMKNNINSIIRAEKPEAEIINQKDCLRIITPLYSIPSRDMVTVFGFFEVVASREATTRIRNLKNMEIILINKVLEKASVLSYYIERLSENMIAVGTSSSDDEDYNFLLDVAKTLKVGGQ